MINNFLDNCFSEVFFTKNLQKEINFARGLVVKYSCKLRIFLDSTDFLTLGSLRIFSRDIAILIEFRNYLGTLY